MRIINFLISVFIEFGSVVAFTFFAENYGFFNGVKALIFTSFISFIISIVRDKRLPIFSMISAFFVCLFGFMSLYFENKYFIVLELTLFNLTFIFLIFYYKFILKKNFFQVLFGKLFLITDNGWETLSSRWAIAFFLVATSNEFVWHFFGEGAWIYFRLYIFLFLGIFGFYQLKLTKKERLPESSKWGLRIN